MSALQIAVHALLGAPGVAALVSDRVYPVMAPQGSAVPHIVVRRLAEDDREMLAGASGWRSTTIETACIAASATDADNLGEAVIAALGDLTHATVTDGASPPGFETTVTMRKAGADVSDASDDATRFRRLIDFIVDWRIDA